MDKKFSVKVQDYESGQVEDRLTADRIERVVAVLLDTDGSDGSVVVEEVD